MSVVVALEFLLVLVWSIAMGQQINLDAGLLLDCGQKIYQGELPYVDFYEFNPPLIMYLSVIPAWFSSISGMHLCTSFQLFVCVSIAVGSGLIYLACIETGLRTAVALRFISISMLFHGLMLYFDVFGEREHFLVVYGTAFLILRSTGSNTIERSIRPAMSASRFIAGLMAGVAFNLKPYFLVIPFLVEIRQVILRRRISVFSSTEMAGFGVATLAYITSWFLLPSLARRNYFQTLLPFAMSGYDSYSGGLKGYFSNFLPYHPSLALFNDVCLGLFVLVIIQMAVRRTRSEMNPEAARFRQIESGMILAWTGSLICFISQKKGWFYHMIPMNWFVMLASTVSFGFENKTGFNHRSSRLKSIGLLLWPLLIIMILFSYSQVRPLLRVVQPSFSANLAQYIATHENGNGQVIVIASSVSGYPALLMAGRTAGSRFLDFFQLPSLYYDLKFSDMTGQEIYQTGATNRALEKRFLSELFTDIDQRKPGMILINKKQGDMGLPKHFNIRDYYYYHGIDSLLKSDYSLLGEFTPGIPRNPTFEVWVRKSVKK